MAFLLVPLFPSSFAPSVVVPRHPSFVCFISLLPGGSFEPRCDFDLAEKNESQVAALLSAKPTGDGDEEKDEGGFGASLAMSEFRVFAR